MNNFEAVDCFNEKFTDLKKEKEKEKELAEKDGNSNPPVQSTDINEEQLLSIDLMSFDTTNVKYINYNDKNPHSLPFQQKVKRTSTTSDCNMFQGFNDPNMTNPNCFKNYLYTAVVFGYN